MARYSNDFLFSDLHQVGYGSHKSNAGLFLDYSLILVISIFQ